MPFWAALRSLQFSERFLSDAGTSRRRTDRPVFCEEYVSLHLTLSGGLGVSPLPRRQFGVSTPPAPTMPSPSPSSRRTAVSYREFFRCSPQRCFKRASPHSPHSNKNDDEAPKGIVQSEGQCATIKIAFADTENEVEPLLLDQGAERNRPPSQGDSELEEYGGRSSTLRRWTR